MTVLSIGEARNKLADAINRVFLSVGIGGAKEQKDVRITARVRADVLNVRDFGAKGDGNNDDAAAFQQALDRCHSQDCGIVRVPSGQYLIKTHLTIPESVTLEGNWRAPATYRGDCLGASGPGWYIGQGQLTGSVLLAVEGAGKPDGTPFITLNTNSTLKGVTIFYPEQTNTNPPVAYPWTVATAVGGATNPSIIDVLMVNPYQAVDFGSYASPRHHIRNLDADALYRGIYLDNCLDIGRIENVHLWPFWQPYGDWGPVRKFTQEHGQAFIFGRTDWQLVHDCFAVFYKIGFRFTRNAPAGVSRAGPSPQVKAQNLPAGNVMITGGGSDICTTAVLVEDSQSHGGVSFVNCQIYGDVVVQPTNTGMVRFTSCGFFGTLDGANGVAMAKISGQSRVSFSNCSFYVYNHEGQGKILIHVLSGKLGIVNCTFITRETTTANLEQQILLDPDVRSAVIASNDFSGHAVIINNSKGKVEIAHNVDQTGTPSDR